MTRWRAFVRNTTGVLVGLRRLLFEVHVLIAMVMLVTLAALEFWHVVVRMVH